MMVFFYIINKLCRTKHFPSKCCSQICVWKKKKQKSLVYCWIVICLLPVLRFTVKPGRRLPPKARIWAKLSDSCRMGKTWSQLTDLVRPEAKMSGKDRIAIFPSRGYLSFISVLFFNCSFLRCHTNTYYKAQIRFVHNSNLWVYLPTSFNTTLN